MSVRAIGVVIVMLLARLAAADDQIITLPKTKAELHVPASWERLERPGVVVGFRGPSGTLLAVTRAQVPNPDAWRSKTRDAYLEQIERGAITAVRGKRLAKSTREVNGIPALDLEVKRDDGATIVLRVLLYRTYALSLALEVRDKRRLDEARGVAKAFGPPKP